MMKMDVLPSSFLDNYSLRRTSSLPRQSQSLRQKNSWFRFGKTNDNSCRKLTIANSTTLIHLLNLLDEYVIEHLEPPLPPFIHPDKVLSGNFAPVGEIPPTACLVVDGTIPPSLRGTYIRNGPNPQFVSRGPYHILDGDGMLHAITINDAEVVFCSRFIKTYKYNVEREIGSSVVPSVFSSFNGFLPSMARCAITLGRFLIGQYDPRHGMSAANTSLMVFARKLYALWEADLPYALELTPDGDIVTLGREDSFGGLSMTMTAHPKIDGETGEIFAYRYGPMQPFLVYFWMNSEGVKQQEIPIFSLKESGAIHDFAISKNFAIFPENQIAFRPQEILKSRPMVSFFPSKAPRLGIIPRYAKDGKEMWWVEVPGFNMVHATNAWEEDEGNTIAMVASNVLGVENLLRQTDLSFSLLEIIQINVKERSVRRRPLSAANLDFAVINPAYLARKNRFIYAAVGAPMPKISGIVKIDLSLSTMDSAGDCTVARRLYPVGCYGGEPYFVAKDPENGTADEDDGYLLTYVHHENTGESKFLVMDAKSPTLEIVATINLPRRVPYGFHGIFVHGVIQSAVTPTLDLSSFIVVMTKHEP